MTEEQKTEIAKQQAELEKKNIAAQKAAQKQADAERKNAEKATRTIIPIK